MATRISDLIHRKEHAEFSAPANLKSHVNAVAAFRVMRQFSLEACQLSEKNHFFISVDSFPFSVFENFGSLQPCFISTKLTPLMIQHSSILLGLLCRTLHVGSRCKSWASCSWLQTMQNHWPSYYLMLTTEIPHAERKGLNSV